MSDLAALLDPLAATYRDALVPLPAVEAVAPDEVPEPYRSLLVHERDMTPTLERFHAQKIHLKTLNSRQDGELYRRQVVIVLNDRVTPVEFGAIAIHLDRFDQATRKLILDNWRPLGGILKERGIAHASRPQAYIRVTPDKLMRELLHAKDAGTLWGRCNRQEDPQGNALADIVEVLPPLSAAAGE